MLYLPPPREAYSPHITIDGTNLNAAEHFTYLGSVISNNATVSKDLGNRLSMTVKESTAKSFAPPLHKDSGIQLEPSSFPPSCTVQRPGFSTGSRSGYFSGFIDAACAPSLVSNGKTMYQTKKSSRKPPAQHRVHLASGEGVLGWPRVKDGRHTHAESSLLQRDPRRKV